MPEEKWEVIFCRPIGIKPTDCEAQILAELCHVKQGEAYNHILSDMFAGHCLMRADVDKGTAEDMAALGNEKLQQHGNCKRPPVDRFFVAKPTVALN